MAHDWTRRLEEICTKCEHHLCCDRACPPISEDRYNILLGNGITPDYFEFEGYRRLKMQKDFKCILYADGKCSHHTIKPETCRSGPFTFDIKDDKIEIFLKFESICPIVRILKEVPRAYHEQYLTAIENISNLVSCLPEDELEEVCRIEEPLTEKVSEIPLRKRLS